jgi:RNA polymerase sigma-70 factor, ECF subfamily
MRGASSARGAPASPASAEPDHKPAKSFRSGRRRTGLRNDDEDVDGAIPDAVPDPATGLLELYDEALPQVYGYLLSRCGDVSLAEDLTADCFLAAAAAALKGAVHRPDPPPMNVAWLIGVARHKLVDHWRDQERERRGLRSVYSGQPTAEDPWDEQLDQLRARETLARLGPHHRCVLTLRYLDGLSVGAVAEQIGRSVHATEALLVRARRAFRQTYTEHSGEEGSR